METIGQKILEVRKRKGFTQEQLAALSQINLRTLQRIESDETEPRGNTLKSLCNILEVNMEDLLDYGKVEDQSYLTLVQLSALSFFIFPLGNIIVPLVMWVAKKDKVIFLKQQGAGLLNAQLLWTFLLCSSIVVLYIINPKGFTGWLFILGLFALNLAFIAITTIFVAKGKIKDNYPTLVRIIR